MIIKEGAWDCLHCGRELIPGSRKFCPSCGAPRDKKVQFYLPDNARIVSEESELQRALAGPDWHCRACGSDNKADDKFCSSCGYSLDGAVYRAAGTVKKNQKEEMVPKKSHSRIRKILFILILSITAFMVWVSRTHIEILTVKAFSWKRTQQVQRYVTVVEEAWEDNLPSGARVQSRKHKFRKTNKVLTGYKEATRTVQKKEQVGTKKVKVGTKDLGNGYFKEIYRDEPVYQYRDVTETYREPVYRYDKIYGYYCSYEIERWKKSPSHTVSGKSKKAYWPVQISGKDIRNCYTKETYTVHFINQKNKKREYETGDESVWHSFIFNETCKGKVNNLGNITERPVKNE